MFDFFPALAQGRNAYREGVETIEEVFAKCTILYGFLNIDIVAASRRKSAVRVDRPPNREN
jgi:hypothetical protein